jgi:uncharacterized pyridoxamine 5'-phosphate oxidase family protein
MDKAQLKNKVHSLFISQKLAVLATNKHGQPYNSLVAIAATEDLKCLLFCTSRATSKYGNITIDPRVSLLLDNRSNMESDFTDAVAVTALGTANETKGIDRDELVSTYLQKHPNLKDFVSSPDNALIRVDVEEYILSGFTDVWTLKPE